MHVRGDVFRRMIVSERRASGRRPVRIRVDMEPEPNDEAMRQLELRYQLTASTIDTYFDAGFAVVAQDVILGVHLERFTAYVRSRPLYVVALVPRPDVIARREAEREKTAYSPGRWTIEQLDDVLRRKTSRVGLWLDNSDQTPDETVEEILARTDEARV